MELSETGNSEEYDDFETESSEEDNKEKKDEFSGLKVIDINGLKLEIPDQGEEKNAELTFWDFMEMMTPENVERWKLKPEQLKRLK